MLELSHRVIQSTIGVGQLVTCQIRLLMCQSNTSYHRKAIKLALWALCLLRSGGSICYVNAASAVLEGSLGEGGRHDGHGRRVLPLQQSSRHRAGVPR